MRFEGLESRKAYSCSQFCKILYTLYGVYLIPLPRIDISHTHFNITLSGHSITSQNDGQLPAGQIGIKEEALMTIYANYCGAWISNQPGLGGSPV